MDIKLNDFLQGERESLRIFRQSAQQRSISESKTEIWKQQKLEEAETTLKEAFGKLDQTRKEADTRLSDNISQIEQIRKRATDDLTKARDALNQVKDELSLVKEISINFDQLGKNDIKHLTGVETITELTDGLTNKSSKAVNYVNEVKDAVHHFQNWKWAMSENIRLHLALCLLGIACLGVIFYSLSITQLIYVLLILSSLVPPLLLAWANRIWNFGEKKPGDKFRKQYLWFFFISPVASIIALVWIIKRYPASLAAIELRYPPDQKASKLVTLINIGGLIISIKTAISEAEQYYENLQKQVQQEIKQLHQEHESNLQQIDVELNKIQHQYENSLRQIEIDYKQAVAEVVSNYEKSRQQVQDQIAALQQANGLMGKPWDDHLWESWTPTTEEVISPYFRIGSLVDQDKENRLMIPALVPVIGKGNVIIKCSDEAKVQAAQIVRNLMLRMLSIMEPGKLRFTLIDPVGLGQNMAAFMHLDDYDETLTGGKIWTEPPHIEEQLKQLTEHMEDVIQKFLRDKYPTIKSYNAEAGEIAEPYRLLVIINFPTSFTEVAVRRLISIVLHGPRCGIYTVLTIDTEKKLPYGFRQTDIT